MSNNTVNIRGYLTYCSQGVNGGLASVTGWLYTDSALMGGRHPFTAKGRPAEIIEEYVQEHGLHPVRNPPDFPDQATGVVMRGKLLTYPNGSFLDVRSIHFFQASLRMEKFALNDLTLGGQVHVKDRTLRSERVCNIDVPTLDVWLATDAACNGGMHSVALFKKHAQAVLQRFQQTGFQPFNATVGGRLLTLPASSLIQASFVCPDEEENCK